MGKYKYLVVINYSVSLNYYRETILYDHGTLKIGRAHV